jgi:peptide/nickel transport system permease protein
MMQWFATRSLRGQLAASWLVGLALVSLSAAVMPLPYSPDTVDLAAIAVAPLTGRHWLGTDPLGRDVLAGLLFGARTALAVSLPAAALATLLGTLVGSIAGFWGNAELRLPLVYLLATLGTSAFLLLFAGEPTVFVPVGTLVAAALYALAATLTRVGYRRTVALPIDRLVLGLIALLVSIPLLVLVLTLAALTPPSLPGLLAVLVLTYWPGPARLVRAEMLRIRALPYIEAGRALGLPAPRLLWRHALPNCWHTVRTTFPISVATLIGLETTLSFLGVGLPPETASWGRLLASARLAPTAWWLILLPATAIFLTTLSLGKIFRSRRKQ